MGTFSIGQIIVVLLVLTLMFGDISKLKSYFKDFKSKKKQKNRKKGS